MPEKAAKVATAAIREGWARSSARAYAESVAQWLALNLDI